MPPSIGEIQFQTLLSRIPIWLGTYKKKCNNELTEVKIIKFNVYLIKRKDLIELS